VSTCNRRKYGDASSENVASIHDLRFSGSVSAAERMRVFRGIIAAYASIAAQNWRRHVAVVLDGKALSKQLEAELAVRVQAIREAKGFVPVLATILVGDDPASATYVKMKANACHRVGMESRRVVLSQSTTTEQLLNEIDRLNADPRVQGILLQHPVPPQIDERQCFDRIALEKDVDGVTVLGFGKMAMGEPAYGSATPAGIMRLLAHYQIPIEGRHAVVVGRSPILGKPAAMMLLNANATVSICHSRTRELSELVRQADILVGAVGKPQFIKGAWVKEGAVVVDAGYHSPSGSAANGVGDIELPAVIAKCSAYTPVPGGVGPMTIAMLMEQTVEAAEKRT
jgi:methylenetetrahydrofolate dehydrogenase (NADP+) / methenyltetrahydrofolate cyclohydrolase